MSECKKLRATAVSRVEVKMQSSSSVIEVSMGGSNRTGGDFSTEEAVSRCE